jgi:hypothetical protein
VVASARVGAVRKRHVEALLVECGDSAYLRTIIWRAYRVMGYLYTVEMLVQLGASEPAMVV